MSIEIAIQGFGTNGSATSLDSAVLIKRFERRRDLETVMDLLTKMYEQYKAIKAGKKPKLKLNDVFGYAAALEEFKRAMRRHWFARQYPDVLPKLKRAYADVLGYAQGGNVYNLTEPQPEKVTPVLEWLRT